ncbi:hypothetical protein [Limoniibacter endophyticus]|uniref:Cell division and transport-associated protein TolA n=1 Tax=Limoniibacter endophyticus TaxID=1565040 RepID=A0A8J3DJ38_9HYPH|nr:hypothetical protein [Limoniibacter endophyticus]GHC76728.1 hypothetical protein GCM10010136_27680 [Limoniibacter endophyticus]
MKAGLTTSAVLHVAAIAAGLVTLAPRPMDMTDSEALPVDVVIADASQLIEGDKKAPISEKPAPTPTTRPDVVPDAQKVGNNSTDTDKAPTPEPKPRPVEQTQSSAAAAPEPAPAPTPEPEPAPEPAEVQPAPPQEAQPAPEPTPAPEAPAEQALSLPTQMAAPQQRPQPPREKPVETAEAKPEKPKEQEKPKAPEKKPEPQKSQARDESESDFDADDIAALLNKEKASGGGAKRSEQTASLGASRTNSAGQLTQSEMDSLRGQIQRCWNVPAGALEAENLRVTVKFNLNQVGAVEGSPRIVSGGGSGGIERAAAESARRAVLQCAPYTLPAEKYATWSEVTVNFDPSEMF